MTKLKITKAKRYDQVFKNVYDGILYKLIPSQSIFPQISFSMSRIAKPLKRVSANCDRK